jgi:hypothetical protein
VFAQSTSPTRKTAPANPSATAPAKAETPFFPLTFSDSLAAGHPNVTVTALGGAGAGRRFFAEGADHVVPANLNPQPALSLVVGNRSSCP